MTVTQAEPKADGTIELPGALEAPSAKLVYCYLAATGASTVDELCGTLDCGKLTLLPLLGSLCEQGHVRKTDSGYVPS
jgi:hypothetical protein